MLNTLSHKMAHEKVKHANFEQKQLNSTKHEENRLKVPNKKLNSKWPNEADKCIRRESKLGSKQNEQMHTK